MWGNILSVCDLVVNEIDKDFWLKGVYVLVGEWRCIYDKYIKWGNKF